MRVGLRPDLLPVKNELAELGIPASGVRIDLGFCIALRRRMREGEERGSIVARISGPPAELDLLGVSRVAEDELVGWRLRRPSREEGHGKGRTSPTRR